MKLKTIKIISALLPLALVLFFFQNCGSEFESIRGHTADLPSLEDPLGEDPPMNDDPSDPNPSVTPTPPPPPVVVSPGAEFFDGFEYEVSRQTVGNTGTNNNFITRGGWSYLKSQQLVDGSGSGYLYTTERIPGYNGSFPGINSRRVLAMEALPRSSFNPNNPNAIPQTDFYLQFGNIEGGNASPRGNLPGNAWIQFWFYSNDYDGPGTNEDQRSVYEGGFKFLYPCNTFYPCIAPNFSWLFVGRNHNPNPNVDPVPSSNISFQLNGVGAVNQLSDPADAWELGPNLSNPVIASNRWYLIKLHMDTSVVSARYEMWIKPQGAAQWTKTAEWIDGLTENFNWRMPVEAIGGHRGFRMPTTFGRTEASDLNRAHDSWMYLDDFVITDSEAELPVY